MKQIEQPAALAEQEPVAWWHRKSKLRDAAQQALEALEDHAKQYPHMQKGYTVDAITALRTALAEQPAEQQPLTREEIFELAEPFGEFKYGDAQGHKRIDFANAIIAAYERKNGVQT